MSLMSWVIAADNIGKKRRAFRRNVHDHHEGQRTVGRNGLENLFYDLMATEGSPDTDNHWSKEMCAFCFVALLDFF
jgi:hypothetical protein